MISAPVVKSRVLVKFNVSIFFTRFYGNVLEASGFIVGKLDGEGTSGCSLLILAVIRWRVWSSSA